LPAFCAHILTTAHYVLSDLRAQMVGEMGEMSGENIGNKKERGPVVSALEQMICDEDPGQNANAAKYATQSSQGCCSCSATAISVAN